MTDVVARERPLVAPMARLSRVRCGHCAMPVRGSEPRCWSCGLDPTSPIGLEPATGPARPVETRSRASRRVRVIAGTVLMALVLAAIPIALLAPGDDGRGVRGIAARVRGSDWQRVEALGASADFPGVPVRSAMASAPGLPRGERLLADRGGLRTELQVAEVADGGTLLDGSAVADRLVDGYATANAGRVLQRTPLYLDGAAGLDGLISTDRGTLRVRATVVGTTAYLLAVLGPPEAFRRFTDSFRRAVPAPAEAVPG